MPPAAMFDFQKRLQGPLREYDMEMPDEELEALDSTARKNHELTFCLVPKAMIRPPHMTYVYWSQKHTTLPAVPADLQLEWYLSNFNAIARERFVAKQEGQDKDITRAIWYYGLDEHHSFCRNHRTVRYNLIVMAWAMANNFPCAYIPSGTQRFILSFVQAWLNGLVDTENLKTQSFKDREVFIDFWLESEWDLMEFGRSEVKKVEKLIKKLREMSLPPNLFEKLEYTPENIVWARQNGTITDAEFKKYGPTLVLDYILTMSELSEENRVERKDWKDIREEEDAKKVERYQAKYKIDPRRKVPWESELIQALLGAVPSDLPHPVDINKSPRPSPLREPWLDKITFFEILEDGLEAVEEEVEDVLDAFEGASLGVDDVEGMQTD